MTKTDVVVVAAGSVGVACAFFSKRYTPGLRVIASLIADLPVPCIVWGRPCYGTTAQYC